MTKRPIDNVRDEHASRFAESEAFKDGWDARVAWEVEAMRFSAEHEKLVAGVCERLLATRERLT